MTGCIFEMAYSHWSLFGRSPVILLLLQYAVVASVHAPTCEHSMYLLIFLCMQLGNEHAVNLEPEIINDAAYTRVTYAKTLLKLHPFPHWDFNLWSISFHLSPSLYLTVSVSVCVCLSVYLSLSLSHPLSPLPSYLPSLSLSLSTPLSCIVWN